MGKMWDRQRNEFGELEPMLWFHRFDVYYRPQGPERTLHGAYSKWREVERGEAASPGVGTPEAWTKRFREWNWKERAEAWDAERREERLQIEQEARVEMLKRHARAGQMLQDVGAARLQELLDAIEKEESISQDVDPSEARIMTKDGISIEREATGMPTELLAVLEMSDEEIVSQWRSLKAKAIRSEEDRDSGEGDADEGDRPQ